MSSLAQVAMSIMSIFFHRTVQLARGAISWSRSSASLILYRRQGTQWARVRPACEQVRQQPLRLAGSSLHYQHVSQEP